MKAPFVYGTAADSQHFTDREKETLRLKNNFEYGVNTIIISPRRWGKTSLVNKVASMFDKNRKIQIVRIDAFSVRSEEDFYRLFATEIIKQTASKAEEWIVTAKNYLSTLVPAISVTADPMHPLSRSFNNMNKRYSDDVLHLPEQIAQEKGIQIVVCIDEFQQIGELSDSVFLQKKLRSVWQHQQATSYCLFGSKKHLLMNMFNKYSMPFYKFGDVISLERIPLACWQSYIQERFINSGKEISDDFIRQIYEYVDGNSSYVQQLSWLIWIATDKVVNDEIFTQAKNNLINLNGALFLEQLGNLTSYQLNFLRALLCGKGDDINKKETIDKFELGSSANVSTIKKALQKKEVIEVSGKNITFTDPLLPHWFHDNINLWL